jgi:hypothetical protein
MAYESEESSWMKVAAVTYDFRLYAVGMARIRSLESWTCYFP